MVFKPNISKLKHRLLLFISVLFIAIILQPTQTVHAYSEGEAAVGKSIAVDVTGSSNSSGNVSTPNGITYKRTGYLCYLLTADGADIGLPTYAFESPEYSQLSGSQWIAVTRKGMTHSNGWEGTAPWNLTPYYTVGSDETIQCITNEAAIKAWFLEQSPTTGTDNSLNFVKTYWGEEAAHRFGNNEYILVIETLMNFQLTVPGGEVDIELINRDKKKANDRVYAPDGDLFESYDLISYCRYNGYPDAWKTYYSLKGTARDQFIADLRQNVVLAAWAAIDEIYKNSSGESRTLVGEPFIGTVPNIIDYKYGYPEVGTWYNNYLNKTVPFAERIIPGGPGEKAGFVAWKGGTSNKISDSDVKNHGLAMMVITASTAAQTTCDEPLIPSPHDPPKESDGKITIVKSYREKINGEEKHVATTSRSNLGTQIIIENEQTYQVVGWKTSTTTNTNITSINWESSVPSSVQQQGTTPKSVTLQPTETCLYVLLEKVEEEPPEEEDYNYLLSESSITRAVWFSNPDHNKLGNMNNPEWIYEHKFNWASPATPYCEGHGYYKACAGNHTQTCSEAGCTAGCPSSCTKPHHEPDCLPGCMTQHEHEKCTTTHKYNCGSLDCPLEGDTAKCSGTPEWVDKTLELTITNTKQNSYPDILATKEGWNAEVLKGGVEKRFYANGPIERTKHSLEEHKEESEITNWDYVCVLLRGKDKLTVAEWQNNGDGNNAKNDANTDLFEVSPPPSRFTIANTDSGTRKTTDYYETFDTFFNRDEEEGNLCTTGKFTIPPKDMPENEDITEPCQPEVTSFVNTLSINGVKVKVDVYSGTAAEHKNDTSIADGHLDYDLSGFNRSSGRMVKSSNVNGTIVFTPYIEMKYDTLEPPYNKQAFVLSEFTAQITPNDYGELSWNTSRNDNLTLVSAQWSTHADAVQEWGVDNVLPGGATLSLHIKKDDRQQVAVTTWQCVVIDKGEFRGLKHVTNTGGTPGDMTEANATAAHNAFVATVTAALESTNVQQYVEEDLTKDDAFGGIPVSPGSDIARLNGTTGNAAKASTEAKYYFRDDNTESPSNEGDLDVRVLSDNKTYYHFAANTHGDIYTGINGVVKDIPALRRNEINQRTLVEQKINAALEQGNKGDGSSYDDTEGVRTGKNWYNEAFDGITVIMQQTILEVGYNDPPERSSVLDPKLTPRQTSQKSLFDDYFFSQFKTQNHSAYYNEEYIMGEFKGAKVMLEDMTNLFYSRKFWIPNATTQDLH